MTTHKKVRNIGNIDLKQKVENIEVFEKILKDFNAKNKSKYDIYDIKLEEVFPNFVAFIGRQIDEGNYIVEPKEERLLFVKLGQFKGLKTVEKYITQIEKTYEKQGIHLKPKDKTALRAAYNLMEHVFFHIEREQRDPEHMEKKLKYFTHLAGVFNLFLENGLIPNVNQAITLLLHDFQEDIPFVTKDDIEKLFNAEVAARVDNLSKKERIEYIQYLPIEIQEKYLDNEYSETLYMQIQDFCQEIGHHIYYSQKFGKAELPIKLADRLHNLMTLDGLSLRKIHKTIVQTEQYFFDEDIKQRAEIAGALKLYRSLKKQIQVLKKVYCTVDNQAKLYQNYKKGYKAKVRILAAAIENYQYMEQLWEGREKEKMMQKQQLLFDKFVVLTEDRIGDKNKN